jgi:hypothetical protein
MKTPPARLPAGARQSGGGYPGAVATNLPLALRDEWKEESRAEQSSGAECTSMASRGENSRQFIRVLAEQHTTVPIGQVSWLTAFGESDSLALILPSQGIHLSGIFGAARRLQWRDRAGFTPDFPVRPYGAQKDNPILSAAAREVKRGVDRPPEAQRL